MNESLHVAGVRISLPGFSIQALFDVRAGERLALCGRSGCGKTTLLRVIAGLESLTGNGAGGKIVIGSDDVTNWPPERRNFGVVFQDPRLFPALNVLENAAFGLRMRGVNTAERHQRVMPWLEKLGLASRSKDGIGALSGGEKQRISFIRAVVWKPRVLLLDEPFSALDPGLRHVLRRELLDIHDAHPVPMLLVTHDQDDIRALATATVGCDERTGGTERVFKRF